MELKQLIIEKDYKKIREALEKDPTLANNGLPYSEKHPVKAPPLHRICDGVHLKLYTDEEAVEMASIFLEFGARVDGDQLIEKSDTPLIAAASLYADKVAFLYIDHRATINHAGTHGGTALHWAAWCGRDKLVKRLLDEGAEINKRCIDFTATPLYWAVHGLKKGEKGNLPQHLECVRILIEAGADKNVSNIDGKTIFDLAEEGDVELNELLGQSR